MATELTELLNKLEQQKIECLSNLTRIQEEKNKIISEMKKAPVSREEFEAYKEEVSKMLKELTDKGVPFSTIDGSKFAPYTENNSTFYQ